MFIQIHMLQSMPPGNLNRDDTGQPKKCMFGGVTRGRISSQCLKRNIRLSPQFKEAFFGNALAVRTQYLPRMVADQLNELDSKIPDDDLNKIKNALAGKFKSDKSGGGSDDAQDDDEAQQKSGDSSSKNDAADKTGQLVFFPPPFARSIAELIKDLRSKDKSAYTAWLGGKKKDRHKHKAKIEEFENEIFKKGESLTVDIGLFGRMTTSDLVVNVEAACQVAHAISTHETLIESDYFTAMDDKKKEFAPSQTEQTGAAFLGSGETQTFFNSAVYYKYLNLDVDAVKKHLSWHDDEAARAAGVLVSAVALANPTGKQNSFAAHGVPELILVEVSKAKRPISYANAFLQAVEGGTGRNLMTESAKSLHGYIDSVAATFAPTDVRRLLLALGPASTPLLQSDHRRVGTLDELIQSVVDLIASSEEAGVSA